MSLSQRIIVATLNGITGFICHIDDTELAHVPDCGPLIIYTNHVNVLEIPIIYTRLQPRHVRGLVLAERWKNPLLRWMLDATETIPIHRASADIAAIRTGLDALAKQQIIIISPEGTRSHDGVLQPAHPGVVLLALHSAAPLMPVAYFGSEGFTQNMRRLRRTNFHLRVGTPFHLVTHAEKVTRLVREKMLAEMMQQLALLLPQEYRGQYGNGSATNQTYLSFE